MATTVLNEELQKHKKGLDVAPETMAVAEYLTRWVEEAAKPTIPPNTYRSYEQLIRIHIVPAFGRTLLTKLRPLPGADVTQRHACDGAFAR